MAGRCSDAGLSGAGLFSGIGSSASSGDGGQVVYGAERASEFVVAVRLRPVGGACATELFTRLVTGDTGPTFVSAPG